LASAAKGLTGRYLLNNVLTRKLVFVVNPPIALTSNAIPESQDIFAAVASHKYQGCLQRMLKSEAQGGVR
jgi:hypothetical protein